jgi:hypothetical protein
LIDRETSLKFQIGRTEAELQIRDRLVSEAEASIEKMEAYEEAVERACEGVLSASDRGLAGWACAGDGRGDREDCHLGIIMIQLASSVGQKKSVG